MGRAIVREPKAFLMDEPLSNLDAKLRVKMRSEIARIQHELSVTTLYVTHDQVEAMTMGDRVAVIRKGVLQQIDTPQFLYDHPANLFVAGFIGSPSMNMVGATLARTNGSLTAEFGGYRLAVPDEVLGQRPDLKGYEGKEVVLGIRPEDMEDATIVPTRPADRRIRSAVILREALGADVLAHFMVKAPDGDDGGREGARARRRRRGGRGRRARRRTGESEFMARLNPRTRATKGEEIELVIDVNRMHFFDPDTGRGIYGGRARRPSNPRASISVVRKTRNAEGRASRRRSRCDD